MSKIRVLVADDDPINLALLVRVLSKAGMETVSAEDGTEVLALLRKSPESFDVLLMDLVMPRLNGFQVLKRLKAHPQLKHIPVILLSAKGRNVDQKVGLEVGADDYVTKPFSPRKLVERINAVLGQGAPRQRLQA